MRALQVGGPAMWSRPARLHKHQSCHAVMHTRFQRFQRSSCTSLPAQQHLSFGTKCRDYCPHRQTQCASAPSSAPPTQELLSVVPVRPGDASVQPEANAVALRVHEVRYEVSVVYAPQGRVLDGAEQIYAHVGHSGWQDAHDVALRRAGQDNGASNTWVGTYSIPAARLPVVTHLEVQMAFKGVWSDGRVVWDNNANRNWSAAVELRPGDGLVTGNSATQSQASISSLLLRLDHLAAKRLMSVEQATMLRTLAWTKDFSLLKAYEQAYKGPDAQLADVMKERCSFLRRPGLHVVHVACEMAPIAKVGGLADVVTSLARAHQSMGNLVEIILPKYDCIQYDAVSDLRTMAELHVPWDGSTVRTLVWSGVTEGLPVYFLEPHSQHRMFWRGRIYGESDDVSRFLLFSRAALELLAWTGKTPDILHVHDWQTAAVCPMLKELYRGTCLARTGSVLTLHNLAFQGLGDVDLLETAGFERTATGPHPCYHPHKLQDNSRKSPEGEWLINVLQGGIVYADYVTTVSPQYAKQVVTHEYGCGLSGVLANAAQSGRFSGVLNGIDPEIWDPRVDTHIHTPYSTETCTQGKKACKQALLSELGLSHTHTPDNSVDHTPHPSGRPLLAVISRLTEQKGLPLIVHGIKIAIQKGAQVVVLGSAPNPEVHQMFVDMQTEMAETDNGRIILKYDEGLSHRIYAASDMILIPSAFEPCGLTQLISLRYGTVPICRETGGLADTVHDVFHSVQPETARNGYVFQGSDEASVALSVSRAIDAYNTSWEWWSGTLVPRCMSQDWSWASGSGVEYLRLYRNLCKQLA